MNYKILETHSKFKNNKLVELAVVWESNSQGWERATYCTTKICWGYKYLLTNELISTQLIQDVAGQGMNLSDEIKKIYFPGIRRWER